MPLSTGVSAKDALMTAVIAMLNVAGFTAVCPGGVFDRVPQGTAAPYTRVVTREVSSPYSTFGALNFQCEIRLHIYSQYAGTKELDAITAEGAALLHHQTYDVSAKGWQIGQIDYVEANEQPDVLIGDVQTAHRVAIFQATMVQA